MNSSELNEKLSGLSFRLLEIVNEALERADLTCLYVFADPSAWPSDEMLNVVRKLKLADVEKTIALAEEYRGRLVWIAGQLPRVNDNGTYGDGSEAAQMMVEVHREELVKQALLVLEKVRNYLCPKLDEAAAALMAGPAVKKDVCASGGETRKRSTRIASELKLHAAMSYKADNPGASEVAVAKAVGISRSTLRGKKDWAEWCLTVERAVNSGTLTGLKSVIDKRVGSLIAYREG